MAHMPLLKPEGCACLWSRSVRTSSLPRCRRLGEPNVDRMDVALFERGWCESVLAAIRQFERVWMQPIQQASLIYEGSQGDSRRGGHLRKQEPHGSSLASHDGIVPTVVGRTP